MIGDPPPVRPPPGPGSSTLACPLIAALAIRSLGAWLAAGIPCHADECWYLELAAALRAGLGVLPDRGHLWPPGYLAYLAVHGAPAGDSLLLVRLSQALLSTATLIPAYALARIAFGERVAIKASWLLALSPTLIAFSHYVWPETLHLLLFMSTAALLLDLRRRLRHGAATIPTAIAAGVVYGFSCLTKSIHVYFLALALPWLWRAALDRRRATTAAGFVLLSTLVTLLPWSLYASARYQRMVGVEATLGLNLWRGNNTFLPFDADFGVARPLVGGYAPCDDPNPIDRDRCNVRRSVGFVARDPALFLDRIPTKMADLWTPTSFLVRHLRLGIYGHVSPWMVEAIVAVDVAWWLAIAVAAILGLALPMVDAGEPDEARSLRQFTLLLLAYTCAVHAVTFGMSRFRVPLYPLLAIFAARAWVSWRPRELARSGWRLAAVGGTLVALALAWLDRIGSVWP